MEDIVYDIYGSRILFLRLMHLVGPVGFQLHAIPCVQELNLKLACKVASGCLDRHPILHGVLVSSVEKACRTDRGIGTMKGLRLSPLELSKVSEAGIALSLAANNKELLHTFGMNWTAPRLPLDNLHSWGLPEPFLALATAGILSTNSKLIEDVLSRPLPVDPSTQVTHHQHQRHLVLALDKTYLLKGIDIVSLRRGKGYVGTGFRPSVLANPDEDHKLEDFGFLPFQRRVQETNVEADQAQDDAARCWDAAELAYAREILELLVWNPLLEGLPRLPLCSVPLEYTINAFEMLDIVGRTLADGGSAVKTIVLDNATSHKLLKAFLFGLRHGMSEEQLSRYPFWRDIQYESFPASTLPRFPFRKPKIHGQTLFLGKLNHLYFFQESESRLLWNFFRKGNPQIA